ncbi:uncharacterized protein LOC120005311 isoform X2 [Tripterygium wilfordii]|uniref:uncharacterized protein LOC120005311 isoform X2 n=1 Tax=Tripterygium wilfordii TaxID=458696 RepID=UPI0018F834F7|nr:uncharacterized protein LOC120005311 isoform X2 [Tripterygium wilfordii]
MASTALLPINGTSLPLSLQCSSLSRNHSQRSETIRKWGWRRDQDVAPVTSRTKGQAFHILVNSNLSAQKGNSNKEVIMVDPVEAKRLAAKQMQQIQAKEKFKRRRQIEAINGAWAIIGLAAGLVIEGQTGKSILTQLADYWSAIVHLFVQ